MVYDENKTLAKEIAKEHFFCPGAFNPVKFAREFALFFMLRKQCLRFLKKGEINVPLAMNNTVIVINSFGRVATNEVARLIYEPSVYAIVGALLWYLKADVPRVNEEDLNQKFISILNDYKLNYNVGR